MAYDDTLFQLGMDLARSSTAQTEELGETALAAHNVNSVSKGHGSGFAPGIEDREPATTANKLVVDLYGARGLGERSHVERALSRCAKATGLPLLQLQLHHPTSQGVMTGLAVFQGGHISIRVRPDSNYVALDILSNLDEVPWQVVNALSAALEPKEVVVRSIRHGHEEVFLEAAPGPVGGRGRVVLNDHIGGEHDRDLRRTA